MRGAPRRCLIALILIVGAVPGMAGKKSGPSRRAQNACAWEKLADAAVGLEAWVQRCDFGFRKIDFLFQGASLAVRSSDGGGPDPLVDVLDMAPGETEKAAIQRLFAAKTSAVVARRCVIGVYRGESRPGARRYTFVPDAAYQKELDAKADPDEVPEPPCGDWGDAPDGIQYFEAQPGSGARKVLFVRVGQDDPLFDEKTLRLLPPKQ